MSFRPTCVALSFYLAFLTAAVGQKTGSTAVISQGSSTASTQAEQTAQDQPSLADIARKVRKDKPADVRLTDAEGKELFRSVDKVFDFASEDTGFPKHSAVKKAVVGQADIEKFTKNRLARAEYSQRFARSELTMKKFGLLPRDFDLKEFLVKANGQSIAGLYDEENKTIWLLNTVSFDKQGPILAHELTHALQDQNYDLGRWAKAGEKPAGKAKAGDDDNGVADESTTARHAIVEGQAMVVYIDYLLAPFGRNLKDTPGVVASMEDTAVSATIDTELMHKAPMVLREAGSFPYREGLFFEADILGKRGKQAAFQGLFAQPPRNTHEVFDSNAYLERAKLTPVVIPDVRPLLSNDYEVFDSGSFGELDVRALLKQFGDKHGASDFAPAWLGGTYIAFKRAQAPAGAQPTTADVALLYVSHWKNTQAAEHFARFYATTVAKRYQRASVQPVPACATAPCPIGAALVSTEEGPVIVEEWPDNTVIVSESFDSATAAKLSSAVRTTPREKHASAASQEELSMRLYSLPAFRAFQERIAIEMLRGIVIGQ
ncbi:MAG TPA: hypothetical protein VNY29_09215 [Terriglobales bacterium]|jgi:hypothetical protein|nr:hypothetical protein [Terriglobales bacterium]